MKTLQINQMLSNYSGMKPGEKKELSPKTLGVGRHFRFHSVEVLLKIVLVRLTNFDRRLIEHFISLLEFEGK